MRAIDRAKATGSLYLLHEDTKKVVFFSEGRPTFVRSNVLEECLGQILALEGLITQQQCDQTLEAIRRTGKRQGELLVEMGILSAGNLRYGLETQLRRKLFDIFTWPEGRFQFKEGKPKQDPGLKLETSSPDLIAGALLEIGDFDAARTGLDMFKGRYVEAKPALADTLALQPDDEHLFLSLDGSRTAQELVDASEPNKRDELTLLLHALVSAGAVNLPKEASEATATPPALQDQGSREDSDFATSYGPSGDLKPFEDTPLPGELPVRSAALSEGDADIDAAFATVASEDSGSMVSMESVRTHQTGLVDQALLEAEPDGIDEALFDEEIEVIEDDELELIEEIDDEDFDAGEPVEEPPAPSAPRPNTVKLDTDELQADGLAIDDDLMLDDDSNLLELDELDDIDGIDLDDSDLDAELDEVDLGDALSETSGDEDDPEMLGAMRYGEGELHLQAGEWAQAQAALEAAYGFGVDIAELHAMLAYARFKTDENSADMAQHAMDLLDYSASMNPNLDIIYAFRGDILLTRGDQDGAREAAEQALRLNDFNDLALSLMDRLG